VRTSLLSPAGRARAALELLVPRRRGGGDESIARFATRRFGREAYDWLIEPLLGGIHAGDGERLSLAATFPQLANIEHDHGGVLRAMMMARLRPPRRYAGSPAGFVTLRSGLGSLVAALARRLQGRVRVNRRVRTVARGSGHWVVTLDDGASVVADDVIAAVPADAAAALLAGADAGLAGELGGIRFASTVTVTVSFPQGAVPRPLPGYGYVSPRALGGPVIACSWTSHKFPARVPEGTTLLRLFLGRDGDDAIVRADAAVIRSVVRSELRAVHDITAEPALWRIFRWPNAMPQYALGHHDRLARIERRLALLPGLHLAGSSFRGAGIPDCIASGWAAADAALARMPAAEPATVTTT
jgi:oxygen-dependent protoporphyrinogen oxidase